MIFRIVTVSFYKERGMKVFTEFCNECANEWFIRVIRFVRYNVTEKRIISSIIRVSVYSVVGK